MNGLKRFFSSHYQNDLMPYCLTCFLGPKSNKKKSTFIHGRDERKEDRQKERKKEKRVQ